MSYIVDNVSLGDEKTRKTLSDLIEFAKEGHKGKFSDPKRIAELTKDWFMWPELQTSAVLKKVKKTSKAKRKKATTKDKVKKKTKKDKGAKKQKTKRKKDKKEAKKQKVKPLKEKKETKKQKLKPLKEKKEAKKQKLKPLKEKKDSKEQEVINKWAGKELHIRYNGTWCPGKVVWQNGGTCEVCIQGFDMPFFVPECDLVEPPKDFSLGDRVLAAWEGMFFPATIANIVGPQYVVDFLPSRSFAATRSALYPEALKPMGPVNYFGKPVELLWNDRWLRGTVEGKTRNGFYKVFYDGFSEPYFLPAQHLRLIGSAAEEAKKSKKTRFDKKPAAVAEAKKRKSRDAHIVKESSAAEVRPKKKKKKKKSLFQTASAAALNSLNGGKDSSKPTLQSLNPLFSPRSPIFEDTSLFLPKLVDGSASNSSGEERATIMEVYEDSSESSEDEIIALKNNQRKAPASIDFVRKERRIEPSGFDTSDDEPIMGFKRRMDQAKRKAPLKGRPANKSRKKNDQEETVTEQNIKERRPVCSFYLDGSCVEGDDCPFEHVKGQFKAVTTCKFFIYGTCCYGDQCRFSHTFTTPDALEKFCANDRVIIPPKEPMKLVGRDWWLLGEEKDFCIFEDVYSVFRQQARSLKHKVAKPGFHCVQDDWITSLLQAFSKFPKLVVAVVPDDDMKLVKGITVKAEEYRVPVVFLHSRNKLLRDHVRRAVKKMHVTIQDRGISQPVSFPVKRKKRKQSSCFPTKQQKKRMRNEGECSLKRKRQKKNEEPQFDRSTPATTPVSPVPAMLRARAEQSNKSSLGGAPAKKERPQLRDQHLVRDSTLQIRGPGPLRAKKEKHASLPLKREAASNVSFPPTNLMPISERKSSRLILDFLPSLSPEREEPTSKSLQFPPPPRDLRDRSRSSSPFRWDL